MAELERRSLHSVLPGMQLGNYRVLRLLGEGGMGAVYAGQHKTLGKTVAIKTLHSHLARQPGVRSRFIREGQSAARIVHPNVVNVYDVGEEDEVPYLVMEYLEGHPLSHFLKEKKPLSAERAADLLVPAIAAVAAAHRNGIVHRDLKPDNIFICEESGGEKPMVLDFGISKLIDGETAQGLTETSALLGTPFYMSPEQSREAKSAGPPSDQFSLGVILYELTTGGRPFEGESLLGLLQAINSCSFAEPSSRNPEISLDIEAIILRAMAQNPDDRYPSLTDFGFALLPFCSDRVRHLYTPEFHDGPPSGFELTALGSKSSIRPKTPTSSLSAGLLSRKAAVFAGLAGLMGGSVTFLLLKPNMGESFTSGEPVVLAQEAFEPAVAKDGSEPFRAPKNEASPAPGFEILSSPLAEVIHEGQTIGRTPLKIDLPKAGETRELVLRAPGYLSRKLVVHSDEPELKSPIVLRKPQTMRSITPPPQVSDGPTLAPR